MRTTGLSSWPPLCRLARVTAKSAPFRTAAVTSSAQFCLSQNLCSEFAIMRAIDAGVWASTKGVGASRSAEANGAWACKNGQTHTSSTVALTRKDGENLRKGTHD